MRGLIADFIKATYLRFRKPPAVPGDEAVVPYEVTVMCQPGRTTLRMVHPGGVESVLILRQITHGWGTYAEFVDRYKYVAERTLTTKHTPWCAIGVHTGPCEEF